MFFLFSDMGSEKYQELPVSDSSNKASSMTKKGAYAAISYMASAGFFFSHSFFYPFFLGHFVTHPHVNHYTVFEVLYVFDLASRSVCHFSHMGILVLVIFFNICGLFDFIFLGSFSVWLVGKCGKII